MSASIGQYTLLFCHIYFCTFIPTHKLWDYVAYLFYILELQLTKKNPQNPTVT
jgi:hypothetical protein